MLSKIEKIINFTIMATLTRYTTFKSLKQNSSSRVKKSANTKILAAAEVEAFLQLLNKKKIKAEKLKSK
jgi:hypothetical protein